MASHLPTTTTSTRHDHDSTRPGPDHAPRLPLTAQPPPAALHLPRSCSRGIGLGTDCTCAPALPAYGHATAWGCAAALAYLQAYAAPGFALDCPGYAEGHEAMTCLHGTPQYPDACLNGPEIAISDACPQAYMNESANSWLLTGQAATEQAKFGVSYSSIDPFGACP